MAVVVVLPEPCRRHRVEVQLRRFRAEHLDQLVVDDLDHHLTGRDRAQHFAADRPLADPVDEILDHRERHVGLEQRNPDLAHRLDHVRLGERAALAQPIENLAKLVR